MNYKADKKSGPGKLILNPGLITQEFYDGEWKNDMRHGFGKYSYMKRTGLVYEGYWKENRRHGEGRLRFKDGSYYKGDMQNERFTGFGLFVSHTGDQYEGDFKDNVRHGKGTQLDTLDGSIYHGNFVMGSKEGPGSITYLSGNQFTGQFKYDHPRGVGSYKLVFGKDMEKDIVNLRVFGY